MLSIILVVIFVLYVTFDWFLRKLEITNFDQRYVFITGCDTGFGNQLAKRLDSLGFHVIATFLKQESANQLKKVTSERLKTVLLDVTSPEDVRRAAQDVEKMLPPNKGLWAIVNNAGVSGLVVPFDFHTRKDVEGVISVNLLGMVDVCVNFLPLVRKEKGRIINVSSESGLFAQMPIGYASSKFAVEGFTDCLRRELLRQGMTVHIINPGLFNTGILNPETLKQQTEDTFHRAKYDIQEYYGQQYVKEATKNIQKILDLVAKDSEPVISDMKHAVTSQFPYRRYYPGNDSKYFFRYFRLMPEWLTDFLYSRIITVPKGTG